MSLYSSQTKLLTFSDESFDGVKDLLTKYFDGIGLFRVGFDGSLVAHDTSGAKHRLNAPAIGSVVLIRGDGDDETAASACASLWERAGITPPAIVFNHETDIHDTSAQVLSAVIRSMEAELHQTAESAVRLDRQIAVLREELEDTRARLAEIGSMKHSSLDLPLITFERQPNGATRQMDEFPVFRQLLPYAARRICGIAFKLDQCSFLGGGSLTVSLKAREDDSELISWQVETVSPEGWAILAVDRPLPHRYRYVDLELQWVGTGGPSPEIMLADAFGDPDGNLRTADDSVPHNMLAMRIWTGDTFRKEVQDSWANFPSADPMRSRGTLSVPVTKRQLSQLQPVTEHDFDWAWYRLDGDTLFLHPVLAGASIVGVELTSDMSIAEIVAVGCNPNGNAPPIDFSIIVSESHLDASTLETAANTETSSDPVLGKSRWTTVTPGTATPASVRLERHSGKLKVYFMVRVTGKTIEYAHFWFKNIRMVMN